MPCTVLEPGDMADRIAGDFVTVAASNMIHVFRQDWPGQHRRAP